MAADGARVAGGQVLSEGEQAELGKRLDAQPGDLLLIVADEWQTTCDVLGQLRNDLGRPPHEGPYRYLWITDFLMFVGVDAVTGRPKPAHHPFTRPHPDDVHLLESDPMAVQPGLRPRAQRLGASVRSIRIHEPDLQAQDLRTARDQREEADRKFGFFLNPFRYGARRTAGSVLGIDGWWRSWRGRRTSAR